MGVSFLLGPTRSKPSIACAGGRGIIELSPLQAYLNPFAHKYQICETRGHVTHHLLIVEHWQCVHYHCYHFSFHHGECRDLPSGRGTKRPLMWAKGASSREGKRVESTPTFSRGKRQKNQKDDGLHNLKMRVRELFMHREGISTPRAHHKGRQPLIECVRHDFMFMCFPFYVFFFIFLGFYDFYFFVVDKGIALAPTYPRVR